jgi:hypothetical protein
MVTPVIEALRVRGGRFIIASGDSVFHLGTTISVPKPYRDEELRDALVYAIAQELPLPTAA